MAFLLAPILSLFFLQLGALAPVFLLVQVLLQFLVAGRNLLMAELMGLVFLAKKEQQVFLPIAFQTAGNLLWGGLDAWVPQLGQLVRIALPSQDCLHDGLPGRTPGSNTLRWTAWPPSGSHTA